jgi:hypothetical protein
MIRFFGHLRTQLPLRLTRNAFEAASPLALPCTAPLRLLLFSGFNALTHPSNSRSSNPSLPIPSRLPTPRRPIPLPGRLAGDSTGARCRRRRRRPRRCSISGSASKRGTRWRKCGRPSTAAPEGARASRRRPAASTAARSTSRTFPWPPLARSCGRRTPSRPPRRSRSTRSGPGAVRSFEAVWG